jgi:hypothetical protein
LLASYKYTRYNNYKENIHNCLLEYEDPHYLQDRYCLNQVVANLFVKKPVEMFAVQKWDPRFSAAVKLASELLTNEIINLNKAEPLI